MSREEYEAQLAKLDLGDPEVRAVTVKALEENRKKVVNRGIHQVSCEDCIGENLSEAKGCYQCHDAFNMEDCLYNVECNGNKGCCDMTVCFEAENCYSCVQAPLNYDCNFLMHTDLCSESEFCAYSKNLKNCFGCVYLNNKQFYILNQEYSEEEYFSKIAEIKKELQNDDLYNLSLFFISEYENNRLKNEEDSAIQTILPN